MPWRHLVFSGWELCLCPADRAKAGLRISPRQEHLPLLTVRGSESEGIKRWCRKA